MEAFNDKKLQKFVTVTNWALFSILSFSSLIFTPGPRAWGVIAGGLIAIANLNLLHRSLKKTINPLAPGRPWKTVIKFYVRLVGCMVVIGVIIARKIVDPIGLLIGLSVVVMSVLLAALNETRKIFFHRET